MIKNVELTNFELHKNTKLEFVSGVNIIAGSTDNGKSAIIRALQCVIQNKPGGILDHRNYACKKNDVMSVSIEFDDHKLARNRSEKINEYVLDNTSYVAMKTEVPTEISDILNISEINILKQFDPFYLLASSSGEVAKTINNVCDLSIIDTTIKKINTIITESKQLYTQHENKLEETTNKINKLDWIEQAELDLRNLMQIYTQYEENLDRINSLEKHATDIQAIESRLPVLRHIAAYSSRLVDLDVLAQGVTSKNTKMSLLEQIIDNTKVNLDGLNKLPKNINLDILTELQKNCSELNQKKEMSKALARFIQGIRQTETQLSKHRQHSAHIENLVYIQNHVERIDMITQKIEKLRILMNGIFKNEKALKTLQIDIEQSKTELTQILSEIDICPFCERELP